MTPPHTLFVIGVKGQRFDSKREILEKEKGILEGERRQLQAKQDIETKLKKIEDEIRKIDAELKKVDDDRLEDLEKYIEPLINTNDVFTEVHLGGNSYSPDACRKLGLLLRKQKNLETIRLDDLFTGRLLSEIPTALYSLLRPLLDVHTLQTVDLSDNAFGVNTKDPLVEFLRAHLPLRHLILNNNGLGPEAARSNPGIKYEIPALETIVCGRNRLEAGSMEAWARAIKANGKGLRTIRMKQNGIYSKGVVKLLNTGIYHAPELEVFDLEDNTYGKDGSVALAAVLSGLPSLRELGVDDCALTAKGWLRVAKALSAGGNTKLEILKLKGNEINGKGVRALVHAAKTSLPALKKVFLNANAFDEDNENIMRLQELLKRRKARFGKDDEDDAWGLDELDELEGEEEEEEEEEEVVEEEWEWESVATDTEAEIDIQAKAEHILTEADVAENQPVVQNVDKTVDELGEKLKSTTI
ncbi:ran GTPase activating protein [Histoplasma capsulatum H143]|uniref:Ran GTPase activating protein n=1 Tax=Ajellomyces capsulatus (strain H143) TaxID=544712 RepID=C6HAZ9_AJECH|nr:ran GTPase activating protein [Histoplasma capsulatum H143]